MTTSNLHSQEQHNAAQATPDAARASGASELLQALQAVQSGVFTPEQAAYAAVLLGEVAKQAAISGQKTIALGLLTKEQEGGKTMTHINSTNLGAAVAAQAAEQAATTAQVAVIPATTQVAVASGQVSREQLLAELESLRGQVGRAYQAGNIDLARSLDEKFRAVQAALNGAAISVANAGVNVTNVTVDVAVKAGDQAKELGNRATSVAHGAVVATANVAKDVIPEVINLGVDVTVAAVTVAGDLVKGILGLVSGRK